MEKMIIPCEYQKNVYLKDRTWIHRGGLVQTWLQPHTIEELVAIGKLLYKHHEEFVIIGHTSNTYFTNEFNIKYLIDTRKLINYHVLNTKTLICECGVPMSTVARFCIDRGVSGYEGMINLPGTVGGAVFGNSGCYGCSMDLILIKIEMLLPSGEIISLKKEDLHYTFRNSSLKKGDITGIILRAIFDISNLKDRHELELIAERNEIHRKKTQDPPGKNLGSTINVSGNIKGFRGLMIRMCIKLYRLYTTDQLKINKLKKEMACIMFNKMSVAKYISDKRMECFIWKDDGADNAFNLYLEMMKQMYNDFSIEIDIKTNK